MKTYSINVSNLDQKANKDSRLSSIEPSSPSRTSFLPPAPQFCDAGSILRCGISTCCTNLLKSVKENPSDCEDACQHRRGESTWRKTNLKRVVWARTLS